MKYLYRAAADLVWGIHFCVVVVVLFGWLVPSIWYVYMAALVSTLISDLVFKYCILSKWEFALRKMSGSGAVYDFTYTTYYTYRLTQGRLFQHFLGFVGIVFTSLSLFINIYFTFWY